MTARRCRKCGVAIGNNGSDLCTACMNKLRYPDEGDYFTRLKKQQEQQKKPRAESPTIHYSFTGYFKKHWYKNGNLYSGYMQNGYRHGKGKWTRATDKYTYDGDWYMGKRQGHGVEEMPGNWRFEGEFYDNKRNGFGKLVCTDGEVYEGEWKDDKKHGYGKKTFASGSRYEGEFFDGKYCGKGIYYNAAKNETYEGEFRDGKLNGHAVVRYADGRVYEGTFTDNSKTGNGKETAPDGTVTLGHWEGHNYVVDSFLRGEDAANTAEEQPVAEALTASDNEEAFDISPESLAAFMQSGTLNGASDNSVTDNKQIEKAMPSVELVSDFRKRVSFFDGTLYAIDRNGVLNVAGRLKKSQETVENYNGRENVACLSFSDQGIIVLGKDGNVIFADSTWKKGILGDKEIKAALPQVQEWSGLSDVACGTWHFVGLRSDGSVVGAGKRLCRLEGLARWNNIKELACGQYGTVGLRNDGTVLSCGFPESTAEELAGWTDIISVACGNNHVVGLRKDGTAVACGKNSDGQCDVSGFSNIGMISALGSCTALIFNDGTIKALGKYHAASLFDKGIVAAVCCNFGKILALDGNGNLHGDTYGVDLRNFTVGFEW